MPALPLRLTRAEDSTISSSNFFRLWSRLDRRPGVLSAGERSRSQPAEVESRKNRQQPKQGRAWRYTQIAVCIAAVCVRTPAQKDDIMLTLTAGNILIEMMLWQ